MNFFYLSVFSFLLTGQFHIEKSPYQCHSSELHALYWSMSLTFAEELFNQIIQDEISLILHPFMSGVSETLLNAFYHTLVHIYRGSQPFLS